MFAPKAIKSNEVKVDFISKSIDRSVMLKKTTYAVWNGMSILRNLKTCSIMSRLIT